MSVNRRMTVLMSTYNGERWLDEQLGSLERQTWPELRLRIRDDGSSDGTPDRLNAFASSSRLSCAVVLGKNLGVFGSFMTLLAEAGDDSGYYAFADQDDVWLPDKCERAAFLLGQIPDHVPAMVYTRLRYTDEALREIGTSPIPTESGFHTALVQNQATGCTVVMNAAARRKVLESVPDWALMHDWWCYLVVSAFGQVIYDPHPSLLYRKHSNNVTPASPNWVAELWNRSKRFAGDGDIARKVTDQAREFKQRYGSQLSEENRALVDGFLSARERGVFGRLAYAATMPVRRNTPFDTWIMRVLIVIGRF
jgi:glycosyltransferase involved in cell wall biosynthesis